MLLVGVIVTGEAFRRLGEDANGNTCFKQVVVTLYGDRDNAIADGIYSSQLAFVIINVKAMMHGMNLEQWGNFHTGRNQVCMCEPSSKSNCDC